MDFLLGLIPALVAKYPVVASVVFVIGALRVIFKPIFAVFRAYVNYTPNPADNAALDKVEASKAYQWVAFVLDYIASIKLPGA